MKDSYVFYTDKLSGEYKEVFDQIEMYVNSQNADEIATEERLGELLDIFFSAEKSGKPVWQITGHNLERFCKAFCSDFGIKSHILHIVDWLKSIAWLLAILSLVDLVFPEEEAAGAGLAGILSIPISLNLFGYLVGLAAAGMLAMIANALLRRMMFRVKRVSIRGLRAAACLAAVLSFFIVLWFLDESRMNIIACPAWIVAAGSAAYLAAYYLLCKKRIKRPKVKFGDLVREEIQKDMAGEMGKKYEKARRKSLKKGTGDLTFEEFLEKEERECDALEKKKSFYYLFPIAVIAVVVLVMFWAEGFESISDLMIFVGVQMVIQYMLMSALWKAAYAGIVERRAWIQAKKREMEEETQELP